MKTEKQISTILGYLGLSKAELARRLGMSAQNFAQKIKRDNFTKDELEHIAEVLNVKYHAYFELTDGTIIK
ncbi:XRE family transcriptional regulator [Erysipelotrichaceae bacterium OH741_COT-311]|nr:XRE family transcriptional regulator [Erysipelotrichaceae bacterium OH741_COT-311]